MSGNAFPQIDATRNQIIAVFGRKGEGKSVWAREAFRAWPGVDKLVIDPTGDADPGDVLAGGVRTQTVHKLPDEMPRATKPGEHVALRYVANPGKASYREDLDRAVGLALYPKERRRLVWVDEAGEVFPANRTGLNARVLLQQSRHWYTSLILCCPRPMNIDPLCISQADYVVMYDVPHPRDRARLAEAIGYPPAELVGVLNETRARGPHWYTMYVAREHRLYRCPPLPMSEGYKHAQQ
ncbi:hypothetical protein F9L07_19905 [Pimelobacter simplex]|uniref:Zona occludens toxin N-terminal domain-containing protein n=1 Tax=Nocardioides simplex TaxID=2045 RepID=A0A7J5DVG8_NOCSI|nr:hypothetical protein [Pimelobacter simplex]KAB2809307.1 hypothetical protein F9L07_19905 [Pimelobacter simplex]